jgi:DNA-binding beta-propeller fold protein YncE
MTLAASLRFRAVCSLSVFRKLTISAAVSVVLASLAGAACATAHAQTAHFSGSQIALPITGLNNPRQITVDASGNLYIADSINNRVLKETLSNGSYAQSTIGSGLDEPFGVTVDAGGNVYIADSGNSRVLKETLSGGIYTQSAIGSGLINPVSVAVDGSGNVYIADSWGDLVYMETLSGGIYTQSAIGSGLSDPVSVAVDGSGNVYIADSGSDKVFMETLSGGSYTQSTIGSSLSDPVSVAVDGSGNVYISVYGTAGDPEASQIFVETLSGGSYTQSLVGSSAYYFVGPIDIAVDGNGNVFIATYSGIFEVTPSAGNFGTVNVGSSSSPISLIFTLDTAGSIGIPVVLTQGAAALDYADAGTGTCTKLGSSFPYTAGESCTVDVTFTPMFPGGRYGAAVLQNNSGITIATGYAFGSGSGPLVNFLPGTQNTVTTGVPYPLGVAADGSGNIYIAEKQSPTTVNGQVVKETFSGGSYTETIVASGGLSDPRGVAVDGSGSVYIVDENNNRVLKQTPSGGSYAESVVPTTSLSGPWGIAVDGSGNVYIADEQNNRVLKETLSGSGYTESTVGSSLSFPAALAVDVSGNVYISENNGSGVLVLKETLSGGSYTQSTVASTAANGLVLPYGIAVDGGGNVYIADVGNGLVLKETLSGGSYVQSTVASGTPGTSPQGVAVDSSGNVYIVNPSVSNSQVVKENFAAPPSLSFASTTFGSVSSPQTVTVENVGNAAMSFPIPSTGSNPSIAANFTLNSTGSTMCPLVGASSSTAGTLAAGASCLLPISFAPAAVGNLSGSLVLTDNTLNAAAPGYITQSIALSGGGGQVTSTITWATPSAIIYGTALSAAQLNASSTVAGTFRYSPSVGTVLNAGSQMLSVTFTPTDTTGYTTATATTNITVSAAMPVLSFTPIAAQTYGAPPFAVSATSASTGAVTYAVASGPATISGNMVTLTGVGTVVLSASQAASVNYTSAMITTSFTVASSTSPFTLTSGAGTGSATVSPGGAATFGLMLTPGAGTTLLDAITFTTTGLPTGAIATFSPATVAAGSGSTSVTLTIQTSNSQTAHNEKPFAGGPLAPVALGFLLLPVLGVKSVRRRLLQTPRLPVVLAFAALSLGVAMSLIGCSNGSPQQTSPPPPQNYPMVVTAKDQANGTASSANLTLTVQ